MMTAANQRSTQLSKCYQHHSILFLLSSSLSMLLSPSLARTATTAALVAKPSLLQGRLRLATRASGYVLSDSRLDVCSPTRQLHTIISYIPNILVPPVVFTGLVLALYTWKSFVMVSLQNKIIYNPYLPPTARHDKISDWNKYLFGIEWREIHLRSIDRTDLALAVASVSSSSKGSETAEVAHHVYILYCQGPSVSLRGAPCLSRQLTYGPGPQGTLRLFPLGYRTILGS